MTTDHSEPGSQERRATQRVRDVVSWILGRLRIGLVWGWRPLKWCVLTVWQMRYVPSYPARWPGGAWMDRRVFRFVGLGPRLLSTTIPSPRQLDRESDRPRLSGKQRLLAAVWRHHSIANAIIAALTVLALLLLLAIGLAWVVPGQLSEREVDAALGTLGTLGEVTGATVGLLLAVVTFGVTLRAQNEQDTWSLLPFVARRYGMFLIIGAAVGVAAADAVMPALYPWVEGQAVRWLLRSNIVVLPVTLVASLWLVCKVIQDAGSSTLTNTLPVIQAAMRETALKDEHHGRRFQSYQDQLNTCGLQYNGVAWYTSGFGGHDPRVELQLRPGGIVADIDLIRLRKLGRTLAAIDNTLDCELTIGPGDELPDHACLVIKRPRRNPEELDKGTVPTPDEDDFVLPASTVRTVGRLLRSVFIIRGGSAR